MLATSPTGSVGVDLDFRGFDFDYNFIFHLRVDEYRRERGMAPAAGVKRGYAHQAVYALFGFE